VKKILSFDTSKGGGTSTVKLLILPFTTKLNDDDDDADPAAVCPILINRSDNTID
jgi:hypothetical protein